MATKLTEYISSSTGFADSTVSTVVEAFYKFIELSLRQGEEVKLEKFGNFFIKDAPERPGRNPRTGEQITIPAKRRPDFKFSKIFVQSIQPDAATSAPSSPLKDTTTAQTNRSASSSEKKLPPPIPANLLPTQNRTWYLSGANNTFVEVPESALIAEGVTGDTPLWSVSTGWKLAKDIPELRYLFGVAA